MNILAAICYTRDVMRGHGQRPVYLILNALTLERAKEQARNLQPTDLPTLLGLIIIVDPEMDNGAFRVKE